MLPGLSAVAVALTALITPTHKPVVPQPQYQHVKMYDALSESYLPKKMPRGSIVAFYGDGLYAWSHWQVSDLRHRGYKPVCIDVWGTMPQCKLLDVEVGDATPARAVLWVRDREHRNPSFPPILYTDREQYPLLVSTLHNAGLRRGKDYMLWVTTGGSGLPRFGPMQYNIAIQNYWGHRYDTSVVWSSAFVRSVTP